MTKQTGYSESDLTDCVNKHSAKPALNQDEILDTFRRSFYRYSRR